MAENKEVKYNEPWILQRADPFVCKKDGWYYFTASIPSYDCIALRRSKTLNGLKDAEEVVVWKKHESGIMSKHIWAPELHYLFGKWYIYFAAGEAEDVWKIRPYVLATIFENKGKYYYVWAEKVSVGPQISNLYIAEMESGYKLKTVQVLLTTPDYDWERHGFWVNEGPAVIKHDGKLFLTYSASDTGVNYCMGMLTADENSDVLDPLSWKKERYPVLKTNEELEIYGPGHNSFTVDEDGNDIMVYHARKEAEIEGDPLYNPNRHAMLMKVRWDENGRPVFSYKD